MSKIKENNISQIETENKSKIVNFLKNNDKVKKINL